MTIAVLFVLAILLLSGMQLWRLRDRRNAAAVWKHLARRGRQWSGTRFDPAMVAALPDPARRYFLFTIRSGAVLHSATEIRTSGQIGLGSKDAPRYQPMTAEQILAPPAGLVWNLNAGSGALKIAGSDGFDGQSSWVRFWLLGTIPIVRAGGTQDHARAAFGRVIAEAVFWAPAALLPQDDVVWEAVDALTARAKVSFGGMTQAVDITVADDGRPVKVVIPRWSDANPDKTYRLQPFGGYLSAFVDFDGYRLPTQVEGGNFIGTDEYFPFYKVAVTDIRFVDAIGTDGAENFAATIPGDDDRNG